MEYVNNDCVFCKIVQQEIFAEIIYEDEEILSFLDIDPINNGHLLIIPKKHCLDLDDLDVDTAVHITKFAMKATEVLKELFKPDGYSIMQNGGYFNDIGHFHMHVFPRYKGDGFGWIYGEEKEDRTSLRYIRNMIISELSRYI